MRHLPILRNNYGVHVVDRRMEQLCSKASVYTSLFVSKTRPYQGYARQSQTCPRPTYLSYHDGSLPRPIKEISIAHSISMCSSDSRVVVVVTQLASFWQTEAA